MCSFNPRARRGATMHCELNEIQTGVSIHAPARGATLLHAEAQCREMAFQSTRPCGARRSAAASASTA